MRADIKAKNLKGQISATLNGGKPFNNIAATAAPPSTVSKPEDAALKLTERGEAENATRQEEESAAEGAPLVAFLPATSGATPAADTNAQKGATATDLPLKPPQAIPPSDRSSFGAPAGR